jgi:hypothetical protein
MGKSYSTVKEYELVTNKIRFMGAYLRAILVQIAWVASRMQNSVFKEKFNRLSMKK